LFELHTAACNFIEDYGNFEVQLQNFKEFRHSIKLYFSRNKETARQNECSLRLMDFAAFEVFYINLSLRKNLWFG